MLPQVLTNYFLLLIADYLPQLFTLQFLVCEGLIHMLLCTFAIARLIAV